MSLRDARQKVRESSNGKTPSGESVPAWKVAPSANAALDGITAADLLALEFDPPRFLVDGLLTEGLTLCAGKPKHGKSWLALLLGWAVASGQAVDGRSSWSGEVLYLALEDTRRRLQSRLAKLRGACGWSVPSTLTLHTNWPRSSEGGLYHVAEWLESRKGTARLVIVDTLWKFRDVPKGNANSYGEDYAVVGEFKKMLDHFAVSGLIVHHTRKLKSEDPFDEISGTQAIAGAVDSVWVLDTEKKGEAARLYVTGRDLADSTIPMCFDRDSGRWTIGESRDGIDTDGRQDATRRPSQVEQCMVWLLEFLRVYADRKSVV